MAEHPLAEHPAADELAKASSEEDISIAVAAAGYLRKLPLNDTFRSLALKEPRAYRTHFASMRIVEVSTEAGLPFDLDDTKLLCAIALNAAKVEAGGASTIERGPAWPDHIALMITGRLLAAERLDRFDMALGARETNEPLAERTDPVNEHRGRFLLSPVLALTTPCGGR